MILFERRLRLFTGLVLAVFILFHLLNLGVGLISLESMEDSREIVVQFWRSLPGSVLLYFSFVAHFLLALKSLYRRSTLKMPRWEAAQLTLGLCIIPLIAGHVAGTWGVRNILDEEIDYEFTISTIYGDWWLIVKQLALMLIAWLHVAVGLHFWLRMRRWYKTLVPVLYPLIVLIPVCALLSFVRIGVELQAEADELEMGIVDSSAVSVESAEDPAVVALTTFKNEILITFYTLLILTLGARVLRTHLQRRKGAYNIYHSNGKILTATRDQSLLESIRRFGIPHASVCGGRARCTTCRVRIGEGLEKCAAPTGIERKALKRIGAAPDIRLACQTRPTNDVHITPLIPPDVEATAKIGGVHGSEQKVVAMFVDLRDSTRLGEKKLPYDVLFILNRFFSEISQVLSSTHGHYAQFAGDGLMALFGLRRGMGQGCRDALTAAVKMQEKMDKLNASLKNELEEPLRIGIGIHCGDAIVGTMGPPSSPNYSAIGDNVNAAARLESQSKDYECVLVVSKKTVDNAGFDLNQFPQQTVNLRGKSTALEVVTVNDMRLLSTLLDSSKFKV